MRARRQVRAAGSGGRTGGSRCAHSSAWSRNIARKCSSSRHTTRPAAAAATTAERWAAQHECGGTQRRRRTARSGDNAAALLTQLHTHIQQQARDVTAVSAKPATQSITHAGTAAAQGRGETDAQLSERGQIAEYASGQRRELVVVQRSAGGRRESEPGAERMGGEMRPGGGGRRRAGSGVRRAGGDRLTISLARGRSGCGGNTPLPADARPALRGGGGGGVGGRAVRGSPQRRLRRRAVRAGWPKRGGKTAAAANFNEPNRASSPEMISRLPCAGGGEAAAAKQRRRARGSADSAGCGLGRQQGGGRAPAPALNRSGQTDMAFPHQPRRRDAAPSPTQLPPPLPPPAPAPSPACLLLETVRAMAGGGSTAPPALNPPRWPAAATQTISCPLPPTAAPSPAA